MRRVALLVLAISVMVAACTPQEREEWSNGPAPRCETTSRGRLLLMAQSVPSATLIPCVGELPRGWEFRAAHSDSTKSVLDFENDTFDLDADVVLAPACDVSEADEIESSRPGTRLFVSGSGETMSFTFDGGCIAFGFETSPLAESAEGRALLEAVPFMTRDTLRELTGWTL